MTKHQEYAKYQTGAAHLHGNGNKHTPGTMPISRDMPMLTPITAFGTSTLCAPCQHMAPTFRAHMPAHADPHNAPAASPAISPPLSKVTSPG